MAVRKFFLLFPPPPPPPPPPSPPEPSRDRAAVFRPPSYFRLASDESRSSPYYKYYYSQRLLPSEQIPPPTIGKAAKAALSPYSSTTSAAVNKSFVQKKLRSKYSFIKKKAILYYYLFATAPTIVMCTDKMTNRLFHICLLAPFLVAKKSQSGEEGNETAAFEEPPPDKGKEETELDSIPIYWRLHGRSVGRDTNDYYVAGGNFLPIGGGGGGIVYLYCDLAGRSPRRYGTEFAPLVRFLGLARKILKCFLLNFSSNILWK